MKNRIIKILSVLALTVLCTVSAASSSLAAEQSAVLFNISESKNMAISVAYDTAAPVVSFVAPNGTVYGSEAIANGLMTFSDSGNTLYYRIPNAMAGDWTIVYDKGSNSELDVTYAPYAQTPLIQSFAFSTVDANSLSVSFHASHTENVVYDYTIYAVVAEGDHVTGQKELYSGSARANEDKTVNVGMDSLSSYGSYKLMLEVKMNDSGIETFDSKVSDNTFSYTNPNTPEAISDFYVEVGVTDGNLKVDWSGNDVYGDGYLVSVFTDDAAEPYYFSEFESNVTSTDVLFDTNVSKIRVEVSYKDRRGTMSAAATKEIDMSLAKLLTLTSSEVTSDSQLRVDHDFTSFSEAVKTIIDVNGEQQEAMPKGKGSFSIAIAEFENEVNITWYAQEKLAFRVYASVYSDRQAPMLMLYEATSEIETDKSTYILAGSTEAGCTVTVNDKEAEVNEDGTFSIELSLNDGANEFVVTAKKASGNSARQTISIVRNAVVIEAKEGVLGTLIKYLVLIITFIVSVIICCHVFISSRKYAKHREKKGKMGAILTIASNTFILLAVLAFIATGVFVAMAIKSEAIINSVEFYKTASASISAAYELLKNNDRCWLAVIISAAIMVVMIVLAIVSRKLSSKKFAMPKLFKKKGKVVKAARKICPVCGAENDAGTTFCTSCGNLLN